MFSSSGMRTARDWAPTSTAMGLFRLLEGYFFSLEAGLAVGAFFALCSSVFLLRAGFHPTGLEQGVGCGCSPHTWADTCRGVSSS